MGSCMSKCCSANSSSENKIDDDGSGDVVVVQEKLVISESPSSGGNKLPCEDLSKTQTSSWFFSSSSLMLSTTNSPSVSSSSSSSSCTSKQNPRIVVLDPQKRVEFSAQTRQPKPRALRGPPATAGSGRPCFPAKRARSSSPNSAAGRKSCRAEPPSSAVVGLPNRKTNSLQQKREEFPRKEIVRARHAYNPSGRERTTRVQQHIHQMQNTDEVSCRSPLADDLNNPLISMDCFIFL